MIQHVTHRIPRSALEDCVAFYEILGFRQVQAPPGIAGRALWLEGSEGDQVHLMPPDAVEPRYPATVEQLRAAGHEAEPRREHWGSPRSYVRDPAGNLVELMEWAPAERAESHEGLQPQLRDRPQNQGRE